MNFKSKNSFESLDKLEVLGKTYHYYNLSKGLFDITIEPLSELWGFYNKEFRHPDKESIDSIKHYIGFDKIRLLDGPFKNFIFSIVEHTGKNLRLNIGKLKLTLNKRKNSTAFVF